MVALHAVRLDEVHIDDIWPWSVRFEVANSWTCSIEQPWPETLNQEPTLYCVLNFTNQNSEPSETFDTLRRRNMCHGNTQLGFTSGINT